MEQLWNGIIAFLIEAVIQLHGLVKNLFHMTDTYVIDVPDTGNALDALMFVLAIDAENVPGIK